MKNMVGMWAVVVKYKTYLDEVFNALLDVQRIGLESTGQLAGDFVNEVVMGHMLAVLHNPDDTSLAHSYNQRLVEDAI